MSDTFLTYVQKELEEARQLDGHPQNTSDPFEDAARFIAEVGEERVRDAEFDLVTDLIQAFDAMHVVRDALGDPAARGVKACLDHLEDLKEGMSNE